MFWASLRPPNRRLLSHQLTAENVDVEKQTTKELWAAQRRELISTRGWQCFFTQTGFIVEQRLSMIDTCWVS